MKEIWSKGDTHEPEVRGRLWIAGVSIKAVNGNFHGNAIECYGETKDEAELRRDLILLAATKLSSVVVR